ncbi:hypothetical protein [Mesorhizobium sp.]|uniref:hypothetical protein n=1 Tax=Mesorhizobium sp. TaxID=1871066 RepID=UPI000FE7F1BD|nr:hypothetical protein [Mesorhizobium sp.]RWK58065.1 MAG: hypothetical protein EOR49_33185 [Mesorhizobium sp.]RWM49222.1 MAG: hypothetical protein EOR76_10045 [Mesorhizobium sp.]RWM54073.1 MAG: hypothetical protein EOR78_18190 [Mesorhizobium sp.]RWM57636.1 MAG: hypothetical protein EOR79_14985 [Mesorhizobium sp.]RWN04219.1 MAG: hypothetical protein EOR85_05525 [Mesorhizobium sp.]
MSNYFDPTASETMRMPNPMDDRSGWVGPPSNPNYAIGSAAGPAPEGKVFVPGMNTYVDFDIAEQLGLVGPQGTSIVPAFTLTPNEASLDHRAIPAGDNPLEDVNIEEMSDEELEALQDQLEIDADDREPSLSETLDDIAECFTPEAFVDGVETMVETGDFNDTIARLSEATGLDAVTATNLLETTVMEATPIASEQIGGERWNALLYAASRTDDSLARRIVSDVVTGRLDPARLANAYSLWWQSLPDDDEA